MTCNVKLIYFFFIFCFVECQAGINLCENIEGCKCRSLRSSLLLRAECKNADPDIEELMHLNVSTLILNRVKFTNISILKSLQNISTLESFYLRSSQIHHFDWNWLPDTCQKVTISRTTSLLKQPLKFEDDQGRCRLSSSFNITRLYIFNANYQNIPQCLPDSIELFSISKLSLTEFEFNSSRIVKWPTELKTLQLKFVNFSSISENVFHNTSQKLTKIILVNSLQPFFKFPTNWPNLRFIQSLTVRNFYINQTTPSDFNKLQELQTLDLSQNQLTTLPIGLPPSLQSLTLNQNLINFVHKNSLEFLHNLTKLNLDDNLLEYISFPLPTNLETLTLKRNNIKYIDNSIIKNLAKLKYLDLTRNRLVNMPQDLSTTLKILKVDDNQIRVIHSSSDYKYCFNCLISMRGNQWICNNQLIEMLFWSTQTNATLFLDKTNTCDKSIPTDLKVSEFRPIIRYMSYITHNKLFEKCVYKIKALECNNASLYKLPKNPPLMLIEITITNNSNLTMIPDGHFLLQTQLTELNLEKNAITQFPVGLPFSLKIIILDFNQINLISNEAQETLKNLTRLEILSLEYNQIKMIYDYQLKQLTSLKNLRLRDNPLVCDCAAYALSRWYIDATKPGEVVHYFLPACSLPIAYRGRKLTAMIGYFTYTLKCLPALCYLGEPYLDGILNCSRPIQQQLQKITITNKPFDPRKQPSFPNIIHWQVLDFSDLELNEENINLRQYSFLHTVNLTGNRLSNIPLQKLPQSLETLILKNNSIEQIPQNISSYLPNLKLLDLQQNKIEFVTRNALPSLAKIKAVQLQNNPLICDCNQKPLIDYLHVQLNNLSNNKMEKLVCFKPIRLEGLPLRNLTDQEYCVEMWPSIVGGVAGGIVLLLFIAIITTLILYKKHKIREQEDILKAFRLLLEEEAFASDKEKDLFLNYQYDAFVSYSNNSTDEDFVYKILEELENKRGRKLCIHERDFIPGRGIADNIVKCISMSRRIILILSRKYISSSWCQYEVQVALAQMHNHRRGKLLIPILLEDVVKNNEHKGSVKTILSLISGIHVPSENHSQEMWDSFWDLLENSILDENKPNAFHVMEVD